MKKIYLLFLLALLPLVASADAEALEINGIYYNLNTEAKTAEVTSKPYPDKYVGEINIPQTVTYNNIVYNVTSIGGYAFYNCSGLTSVTIPNSVTDIDWCAFENCSGLTSVTIGNGVTSIGGYAFAGCKGLTSVIIPNSVTSIGDKAFYNCSGLTSVTIGNGVTTIGYYTFADCSSLTSVTIGNSVTSIGDLAFGYCTELTNVYCFSKNVPNIISFDPIDDVCFYDPFCFSNKKNAILHVPEGSIDAYKAKSPWNEFKEIVAIVAEPAKVTLDKTEAFVKKGKTTTLKATVYPMSLKDKSVTWTSSNTKIATVSANGEVKGIKVGTATITCTSNATGASATCEVTVGYVTLDQTEASVKKGKTITLTPTVYPTSLTDKSVTWKSSNTKVATVTENGLVKGVKAGRAIITCTSNATGLSATCQVFVGYVTLDQTVASVKKGKTVTLTATVYPTTLTDMSVTWKSSNVKVATVSADGEVKGVKAGTAIITCTSNATGLSASCKVTIGYVSLSESQATIQKGKTLTLTPTVYPTSLTDKSVTWTSSNTKVATVTAAGKVKGIKAGTATITCTSNATGLSATCKVTVTASAGTRSLDGDDDDTTGIEDDMNEGATEPYDVYDLSGRMVRHQVTSLDGLPNGIYIVNGKKMLKKDQ